MNEIVCSSLSFARVSKCNKQRCTSCPMQTRMMTTTMMMVTIVSLWWSPKRSPFIYWYNIFSTLRPRSAYTPSHITLRTPECDLRRSSIILTILCGRHRFIVCRRHRVASNVKHKLVQWSIWLGCVRRAVKMQSEFVGRWNGISPFRRSSSLSSKWLCARCACVLDLSASFSIFRSFIRRFIGCNPTKWITINNRPKTSRHKRPINK